MKYSIDMIAKTAKTLRQRFNQLDDKTAILRAPELLSLLSSIKDQPESDRAKFGREVNQLKTELQKLVDANSNTDFDNLPAIDITAPFDINTPQAKRPHLLGITKSAYHPVSREVSLINSIFLRMGFRVEDSRELDDDYHMFGALNFPKDHPARDDYDTFMTEEGLVLPAHTSTMQNRILKSDKLPIRAIIPGRVFRNEDVDSTHEHTFHQVEGVYVDSEVSLGDMLGTIQTFLEAYFGQKIEYKTQPFYFPFVEPGLEYLVKMPKSLQKTNNSTEQWLEVMGCGMIHPNVLKEGGVDPKTHSGFAFGLGIERMVMLKLGIGDVRYFMSGNLDFLSQFGVRK